MDKCIWVIMSNMLNYFPLHKCQRGKCQFYMPVEVFDIYFLTEEVYLCFLLQPQSDACTVLS